MITSQYYNLGVVYNALKALSRDSLLVFEKVIPLHVARNLLICKDNSPWLLSQRGILEIPRGPIRKGVF
jgi:hypothetical protein